MPALETRVDKLEAVAGSSAECQCPTSIRVVGILPGEAPAPEEPWSETCPNCGGKRGKPIIIRVRYDATEGDHGQDT